MTTPNQEPGSVQGSDDHPEPALPQNVLKLARF